MTWVLIAVQGADGFWKVRYMGIVDRAIRRIKARIGYLRNMSMVRWRGWKPQIRMARRCLMSTT